MHSVSGNNDRSISFIIYNMMVKSVGDSQFAILDWFLNGYPLCCSWLRCLTLMCQKNQVRPFEGKEPLRSSKVWEKWNRPHLSIVLLFIKAFWIGHSVLCSARCEHRSLEIH